MATVDTLLVRIEADMSGIRRDLNRLERQTENTTSKVKRSLSGMGGAFKAVIGGVLVTQLARGTMALTKFASDMEEMSAMSEAVFGGFIHSVREQLDEFGTAVGRSRFELEAMAASVQDTFVPLGFARGEAAKLSVQLTKLAVDVASFKNESEQATMQAFQSALVGNHEAVRRFGIVITEAELKAELFRMGITKAAKDVDGATKVQARLNLILAGTKDAQGDAAKTSGSYANMTRALDAQLKLLAADIGNELLPSMKDLVAFTIEATKFFREFLAALGVGGTLTQQLVRATNRRIAAEKELEKVMERIRKAQMVARAANRLLHDAQMELAEAALEEDKILQKLLVSKGLIADETQKQEQTQKKANTEISDAQKFVTELTKKQEILMLQLRNSTEATILQKQAEHELGKDYIKNKELIDQMIEVSVQMNKTLEKRKTTTEKIIELTRKAADAQTKIRDTTKGLGEDFAILEAQLNGKSEAEIEMMKIEAEHVALTEKQRIELKALIDKILAYRRVLEGTNRINDEARSIVESMITPTEELEQKLVTLNAAYLNGAINAEEFKEAQAMVKRQITELSPEFQRMEKAVHTFADGMSNALADAFVSGKLSMQSLADVFKSVVKQMIADAIKAQIIKFLMSSFTGGFFGGGGAVGSGSSSMTFTSASDSFASGGRISRRATGGPVMVGERGPELFIPHSSGVIRNNHDTMNMMNGAPQPVVNQTINIDAGVSQTVRAEVMSMMPRIKSETIAAMMDGKRRGTSISKVF